MLTVQQLSQWAVIQREFLKVDNRLSYILLSSVLLLLHPLGRSDVPPKQKEVSVQVYF